MDLSLPELGEGICTAELVEWLVKPGDEVARGQPLAEVMTDKATMELPSPFTGRIEQLLLHAGELADVGQTILSYTSAEETELPGADVEQREPKPQPLVERTSNSRDAATATKSRPSSQASTRIQAAPVVRRLAARAGVDLADVVGTGPNQRVLIDDIAPYLERERTDRPLRRTSSADKKLPRPGCRIPLRGLRRKIAERMTQSARTIPQYSLVDQCDVTDLVWMRESLKAPLEGAGVKLTYLAFAVKAVTQALRLFPLVNASLDNEAAEIVCHDHYHIGIAVDTSDGLVVPVIRDADQMDLVQLAREIDRLSSEARSGAIAAAKLKGSTFTITSIGNLGGLISTPIINPPEVGILGLGRVIRQPAFDANGNIRSADLMYLSFSFDHCVVDGAVAAHFCNAVCRRLNNPAPLLLNLNTSGQVEFNRD